MRSFAALRMTRECGLSRVQRHEHPWFLPGAARPHPAPRLLPLSGGAHAGLQCRGGHARLVRQGAGRGALSPGVLEHLRDRAAGDRLLPAAGLSAGLPDRHHDAHVGDPGLHLRPAAAVDLRPGAHLRLDGAFGPQRHIQSLAARCRDHQRPAAAVAQFHRRADRHGACAAALHGAADLRRGASARSRHRRRGPRARRLELAHLLAHLRPAHAERHLCRLSAGLRAVARLLHHARFAGRRPGHDDRRPDRAAGARDSELAVCRGALLRAARLHLRGLCACPALHAVGGQRMSRRLLAAACGLIYFFLMLPLLVVFPLSLSSAPYMQFPPPGLSWQWYERYLDDPQWIDATWRSLYIGGATAVLALALIIVPTIILSVAVYGLFAKLKLIGAWYGLVVAHTVLALPFVVLVMTAGLRDFDRGLEQAAAGLGASRTSTLLRITLPLLRPSLVSAGLLAFISSFDELVVALFLAGPNMTLPKKMFDNIMMEIDP